MRFLIVCIHVPFPGKVGAYFTALTRVSVSIFFMITGYFYGDTVARHKEGRQIKKILYLVVVANVIFFIWNNKRVAVIRRKYSPWLYIIQSIFITAFSMIVGKLGIKSIYRCVAPIVVYCATLVFLIILRKVKIALRRK